MATSAATLIKMTGEDDNDNSVVDVDYSVGVGGNAALQCCC